MATRRNDSSPEIRRQPLADPTAELDADQELLWRICKNHYRGNMAAMGRALNMSGSNVRKYIITGENQVTLDLLERLANALGTTVDALRAPAPGAIFAAGQWFKPGDPDYDLIRRVILAAKPELEEGFDL